MGLVALWHMGSSWTRDGTCVPCIGRWILNHCATREVPNYTLWWVCFMVYKLYINKIIKKYQGGHQRLICTINKKIWDVLEIWKNLFKFLLEYSCLTMLYSFLLYSKVNQLYIYIYPLFFRFFHLGHHRSLSRFPVLNSRLSLVIYFIHNSLYIKLKVIFSNM